MFGWREIFETQDQKLFSRKSEMVESAGIAINIKYKFNMNGNSSAGITQFGEFGTRDNMSYKLLVKKEDMKRARQLIYGASGGI